MRASELKKKKKKKKKKILGPPPEALEFSANKGLQDGRQEW